MVTPRDLQLICGRIETCGFRVPSEYFFRKRQFMAGNCPRCSGPIVVVLAHTDDIAHGWRLITDPDDRNYGQVTPIVGVYQEGICSDR